MAQINKPNEYFNTKLYTGTGSNQSLTGVGFQPDWIWIKRRDASAWHYLFDSIRGANKTLYSNLNSGETTDSNNLQSFDSDGFTVGTQADMNASGGSLVSWNWLASNTTASNTDGSITSTVSANTTSGFSIVSYTGDGAVTATVGHGLGVTPKMIIYKNLGNVYNWLVYHESLGNTHGMYLNGTDASVDNVDFFKDTSPTSSVWTMSNSTLNNQGSINHIAYCFAEKKGFSKFGSYTGNGQSEDGPFIYTGFKPAFVIVKKYDSAGGNWVMWDNKRSDVPNANVNDQVLYPNASDAELSSATREIDTLSNGFKIRGEGGNINADADNFIYMAFAENPLVGTNNIPATAR